MSETTAVTASKRTELGTRAVNKLRATGSIPGVLYGHKQEVISLSVPKEQLESLLRHGAHGLLNLEVDGVKESAIIKDLQLDVIGREILHVDFARVSKDEKVVVEVPVIIKGVAPGVAEGGVLEQPLHTIEIRCKADHIQEQVVVNINHLHLDQAIHVKDLELNEGAEALVDPDLLVLQVKKLVEAEEEAAGETAEPELIRREKAEEEADSQG